MSKTFSRVLWIISGVLLILCGILCLSRPVVALAAISLFLGLSMLFSKSQLFLCFFWRLAPFDYFLYV